MKRLPAFFYALSSGREPVREWLKSLPAEDRRIIGEDVEFAWPIGMPLCRSLTRGLWEVRSTLTRGLRQAIWNWPSSARRRSHEKGEEKEDRRNWIFL
jgi:uncharacterized protein (DUF2461 family)